MTGPFQVMPPLTDDEFDALLLDISENGITVPVVYDQHGRLIDGHHRVEIARRLRIDVPQVVREVANAQEARSIAYALNLHRRHLSREQKRDLLAASIKADPHLSDRQHAERAGTSPTTAGAVRAALEESEQLSKLDSRTGADGRTRPAKVTQTTRTTEATKVERDVDLDTGEIVAGGIAEQAGRAAADLITLPTPPTPPREPTMADAIREAKSRPFIVADKAIDRWRQAYKTSDAIGGIAAVLADADTDPFVGMPASWDLWLADLDRTIAVATEWAAAIRRRNLRNVK